MKRLLISLLTHSFVLTVCLSAEARHDALNDTSPHREAVLGANGIKLEYLDWGGTGQALLFLAGLGNTGHIFDEVAPKFTNGFRVLALTRRGYGKSDKPQTNYDLVTLVSDVRQLLDTLQIDRAILVGHSLGGLKPRSLPSPSRNASTNWSTWIRPTPMLSRALEKFWLR